MQVKLSKDPSLHVFAFNHLAQKDKLEADKTGRFYECASKVFGDQTGARQAHVKTLTSLHYLSVLALKPNAAA